MLCDENHENIHMPVTQYGENDEKDNPNDQKEN